MAMLRQYALQNSEVTEWLTAIDLLSGTASKDTLQLNNGSTNSDALAKATQFIDAAHPISSLAATREILPISIINKM